jgi:hypothetical protein
MKKKIITLAIASCVAFSLASAQSLVSAWDFNYPSSFGGLDVDGDFAADSSAAATWGETSNIFSWTGMNANGLSNDAQLDSNQLLRPQQLVTMNDGFGWLVAAGDSASANMFLDLDLAGFAAAELTFAAGSQNGPIDLLVNVGGDVTNIGLTAGQDALFTVDISTLAGLSNAQVGFSFANFTGTDNAVMDNIQVTGTVVPEPSAFAAIFGALALGFTAIRRRRG